MVDGTLAKCGRHRVVGLGLELRQRSEGSGRAWRSASSEPLSHDKNVSLLAFPPLASMIHVSAVDNHCQLE